MRLTFDDRKRGESCFRHALNDKAERFVGIRERRRVVANGGKADRLFPDMTIGKLFQCEPGDHAFDAPVPIDDGEKLLRSDRWIDVQRGTNRSH